MTIHYTVYRAPDALSPEQEVRILEFLSEHLEQYGDAKPDIQTCIDYALGRAGKPGGIILSAEHKGDLAGVVIINFTGMKGYIPENILVYIATHQGYRGQGIGKALMKMAVGQTEGNIALHVEPDNPARKLYEKLGFTNKYLEMRLNK
jgi:ribosomal-protein-alanine N-acetyltransferase